MVHTAETIRIRYFLDVLLERKIPVMLVGGAGTGKTVLINEKLSSLNEDYTVVNVPFNFYTTSEMLQQALEKPLEKKAGKNYGPSGNKKLVYFIDDMNMPEVFASFRCSELCHFCIIIWYFESFRHLNCFFIFQNFVIIFLIFHFS